jgi:hypothetical protein
MESVLAGEGKGVTHPGVLKAKWAAKAIGGGHLLHSHRCILLQASVQPGRKGLDYHSEQHGARVSKKQEFRTYWLNKKQLWIVLREKYVEYIH